MITVKEAVSLLTAAKQIYIAWDGCITPLDTHCTLMMCAYGKFLVESICAGHDRDTFELKIAAQPMMQE